MAVYEMKKACISCAPMIEFQKIIDYILAFWGIVDDQISDENTRNIIKIGKRIERIDLYGRLHIVREDMVREFQRLSGRIDSCQMRYNRAVLHQLSDLVAGEPLNYAEIVKSIERILEDA
jgi:hypothetical protein